MRQAEGWPPGPLLTPSGKLRKAQAVFFINLIQLTQPEDVNLAGTTLTVLKTADLGTAEPDPRSHLLRCQPRASPKRSEHGPEFTAPSRGSARRGQIKPRP
jgi:hypothetical protein